MMDKYTIRNWRKQFELSYQAFSSKSILSRWIQLIVVVGISLGVITFLKGREFDNRMKSVELNRLELKKCLSGMDEDFCRVYVKKQSRDETVYEINIIELCTNFKAPVVCLMAEKIYLQKGNSLMANKMKELKSKN